VILIDTGPLVALADPHDSYNRRATRQLQRLRRQPLATCVPVLVETCFHLPSAHVRANLRSVMDGFGIDLLAPANEGLFLHQIFDWLAKYAEHTPDFADAWLAGLCGEDERLKVWTFDREFRTHWRKPDGKPIPLAVEG
jgi:predicted nucleic acid-binding protein